MTAAKGAAGLLAAIDDTFVVKGERREPVMSIFSLQQ